MWSRSSQPTTRYNGYVFTSKDNMWFVKINNKEFSFNFHPSDVDNITMNPAIKEKLLNTLMIYITFDPDNHPKYIDLARFSLSKAFQEKGIYVENCITKENKDYFLPVVDCKNATKHVPVIKFELSENNETNLILDGNCIIAKAKDDTDIIKLKDRLLYSILNIVKE